jgi:hypothetical protein
VRQICEKKSRSENVKGRYLWPYLGGDDNIERDLKETGYEGKDRIQLPQDTNI